MDRGDVVYVDLEPTIGREQRGQRPVLVVSKKQFNQFGTPVIVPITSGGNFARMAGFAVSLMNTGMQTTGVVRCDQPRAIDLQSRGARRVERAPESVVEEVMAKLNAIFE
jgi:mRNA-degrading endonuclease toxin of MazEF toxin-antitoxin module